MQVTLEQQQAGRDLLQTLITKSWDDQAFKKSLIENPSSAIARLTGKEVNAPANTTIIVEDQTDPSIVYLNIPRKANLDDFQLTDEQLEIVAGGEFWVGFGIGLAIIAIVQGA